MPLKLHPHVPRGFGETLYEERIPSIPEAKTACLEKLLELLAARGALPGEEEQTKIRLVLDELLVNAMEHGHRWEAPRRVHVQLLADGDRWAVRIEDSGRGFDPSKIPDPTSPDAILSDRGRGVLLILSLMDRVRYYDGGRGVLAMKRFPKPPRKRGGRSRKK
jgi:anti-sigma regulatory factor (Ser/Thr protein kinase)